MPWGESEPEAFQFGIAGPVEIPAPMLQDIATLMLETGMRPEEVYRIHLEARPRSNRRIKVSSGLATSGSRVSFSRPGAPRIQTTIEPDWASQTGFLVVGPTIRALLHFPDHGSFSDTDRVTSSEPLIPSGRNLHEFSVEG